MTRSWMLVVTAIAGCALTSKSAPREVRYFSPGPDVAQAAPAPTETARPRLRLGRIVPSAHLRYAIVHRDSAVELAPYETLRWTEAPDTYVRRALVHTLFESGRLDQAVGGAAPTLEIEVRAFEEVVRGTAHTGVVVLGYELRDDRRVIARGTIACERPSTGPEIEPVVSAIGVALGTASNELADRIVAAVASSAR